MRAWVWLLLTGCGRIGFDASTPDLPPPDDAVTVFPGAHADPTRLPLATGQLETPTPPAAMLGAKQSYLDPISGVRVWRLTDAGFPLANSSARTNSWHAGAQASAAWDGDRHTIEVELELGGGRQRHLIDLARDTGVIGDVSLVVQGAEDNVAFTADPTNPRVLFATDASHRLHRVDTATNTVADGGVFPIANVHQFPSVSAAGRVLVAQSESSSFLAVNTITGATDELPTKLGDVPMIDHDGAFVLKLVDGPTQLWRIGALSSAEWAPPTGDFAASAGVSGGFVAVDIDTGPPMDFYFSNPQTRASLAFGKFGGYDSVQLASQWIQTDVPTDQQWVLYSTFEQNFMTPGELVHAIGFLRLDGELRFLAHHYGPAGPQFYEQPRASLSPDGRIVVFTSTMGTGRTDVYAAEVPLAQ